MPIFFILFILFCGWLFYERKKSDRVASEKTKSFWERESEANMTTRKDTSDIVYISVDFDSLPFDESATGEVEALQNAIKALKGQSIANLSEYTNTDLKLKYGVPNFSLLSQADENYNTLITSLTEWGKLLRAANQNESAEKVFLAAIRYGVVSGPVYTELSDIYAEQGETEKLRDLLSNVSTSGSITREGTLAHMRDAIGRSFNASSTEEE